MSGLKDQLKDQHGHKQVCMQLLNFSNKVTFKSALIFNFKKMKYPRVSASPPTISGAFPEAKQPHRSIIQDLTLKSDTEEYINTPHIFSDCHVHQKHRRWRCGDGGEWGDCGLLKSLVPIHLCVSYINWSLQLSENLTFHNCN